MRKLFGVYFSGTGNTKYAVEKLCEQFEVGGVECVVNSIEATQSIIDKIENADTILIAYPIYGSDMPLIMKEFIKNHAKYFRDKEVITLITQRIFSGDGAALAVKYLNKHGAKCTNKGTIHINMPSNISDLTIFKVKNGNDNKNTIKKAQQKITKCANKILASKQIKNGRHPYSWFLGFFGQRLWGKIFMEKRMKSAIKIDNSLCVGCGKCATCCPSKNLIIADQSIISNNNCSACYRCVNLCPRAAISLFSKNKPVKQYEGICNQK